MNEIVTFVFSSDQARQANEIRLITNEAGDPWFVLRDLLEAMESKTKTTPAIESIKQGLGGCHVSTTSAIDTLGGKQSVITISEQALYFLVMRGKKTRKIASDLLKKISGYRSVLSALRSFEVPDDLPDMFVYAIRENDTGNIKLGISRDPEQRLRQLQTGNSHELELVACRRADNRFADERAIHADADAYRLRGEWFTASALKVLQ